MNFYRLTLAPILFALISLAGCVGDPAREDPQGAVVVDSRDSATSTSGAAQGAITMAAPDQGYWRGKALDDPSSPLSARTLYFDFNSNDIREEYIGVLRAHAEYLAEHPGVEVVLEGHCDQRGTREYNLALGERRARMVKRFIMAEGVTGGQVRDVSYGEERPVDSGESDAGYQMNRRVEILY